MRNRYIGDPLGAETITALISGGSHEGCHKVCFELE
jgi:hypothetical protein